MQYLLDKSDYDRLLERSRALDEIDRIINERPDEDEHGNSISYSYRFDKTISRIMDTLDTVREQDKRYSWTIPWPRKAVR